MHYNLVCFSIAFNQEETPLSDTTLGTWLNFDADDTEALHKHPLFAIEEGLEDSHEPTCPTQGNNAEEIPPT